MSDPELIVINDRTDEDGNPCTLWHLVRKEPSWAESRIRHMEKELGLGDGLKLNSYGEPSESI